MSRITPFTFHPFVFVLLLKIIAVQLSIKQPIAINLIDSFAQFLRYKTDEKKGKENNNKIASPININDMDLTMCYTNEAKAHIWHEKINKSVGEE